MISTNNLIKRISNCYIDIILIALLSIYMNHANTYHNKTINMLISFSNTCLFASIFMTMCIKVFIFNINSTIIQNNIDTTDTLFFAMNTTFLMVITGIYLQYLCALLISYKYGFIFNLLIIFFVSLHMTKIIKLVFIIDNNNIKSLNNKSNKFKKPIKEKLD